MHIHAYTYIIVYWLLVWDIFIFIEVPVL